MLNFLEIALVAYLIGALIEGGNILAQLHHLSPELNKGAEDDSPQSAESPSKSRLILIIITVVSIAGAFSWPCRLIHRSMKAYQENLNS